MEVAYSSLYTQNLARSQSSINTCIWVILKNRFGGERHFRSVSKTGEENGQIGEGDGEGRWSERGLGPHPLAPWSGLSLHCFPYLLPSLLGRLCALSRSCCHHSSKPGSLRKLRAYPVGHFQSTSVQFIPSKWLWNVNKIKLMLLYLSLVRAVMGCSNAAPEISCGERSPNYSNMASFVHPPPHTHTYHLILPALEGQTTLSRFIHFGRWGKFMLLLPFSLPSQTKPIWTT